ncbi:MAG TPA: penicillin-binding transpeptidase domain-containing protein [Streptosporangiaceae bacterium]|nr:penicillin-binding transpeptidase domain-containing protein [Streptosporangiaceae bacterium]
MSKGARVGPVALALAAVLVTGLLNACSSSPQPQTTASAYFAAWTQQDWAAMQQLVSQPPADFIAVNQAAFKDLGVHQASFTSGTTTTSGSTATQPFTERLALTGVGTITISSTLHLVQVQGHWRVNWTPATIVPQLKAGDQLALNVTWPARAAILGQGGVSLVTTGQTVTIGVEGARIKDAKAVQAALVAAGAPASAASQAIAAAKVHPTYFEPVFIVSQARYNQLAPTIYPIPGTVFQSGHARSAITPGLAAGVVGTVGPITAQELSQLGMPYDATSVVGQTGLEQADERQLAGQPGATVTVVTQSGARVATVAKLPAHRGTPVTTTIDPATQHAAEAALAGEGKSAALVAVNASTGGVLAAVSVHSGGFDQAIDGGFPPGSTFKVITSTALITKGLTPRSAASCPGTATVDGEVFHNAEGEAPVSTLLQAFTESCNTAFIQLATRNLTAPDLPAAATMLGVGRKLNLGLISFDGSVPQPSDRADLAATSIGQGRVLMSPLSMAMVAAAADTGTVHVPQLVTEGAGTASATTSTLPSDVVSDLHEMMASVVASGTAAGQGLPAGTFAKTGTAQYGTTKPLKIDAWLMGFKGNVAFACLVVNSNGNGGPTCGPIVARFLDDLP